MQHLFLCDTDNSQMCCLANVLWGASHSETPQDGNRTHWHHLWHGSVEPTISAPAINFLYCNNYIAHKLYIHMYKLKISSQSSDHRYFLFRVAEWHWNVAVKFLTCLWASQNTVEPVGLLLWGFSKCHCYFHWVWPSCVSTFLLHPCRDRTWQYRVCYIRDGKSLHVHTL